MKKFFSILMLSIVITVLGSQFTTTYAVTRDRDIVSANDPEHTNDQPSKVDKKLQ